MGFMTEVGYVVAFLSASLSLILLGFAIASYRQTRDRVMLFLIVGFSVFGFKSMVVGYGLLSGRLEHETLEVIDNLADLILLSLIVSPILLARRKP